MKKLIYLIAIISIFFLFSFGIVDSISTLTTDINNHLWVNIIGRWRCNEKKIYEIEFIADGTFNEYYFGMAKSIGNFRIDGDSIVLIYKPFDCSRAAIDNCSIKYNYYIERNTLILKTKDSSMSFYRMNNP